MKFTNGWADRPPQLQQQERNTRLPVLERAARDTRNGSQTFWKLLNRASWTPDHQAAAGIESQPGKKPLNTSIPEGELKSPS